MGESNRVVRPHLTEAQTVEAAGYLTTPDMDWQLRIAVARGEAQMRCDNWAGSPWARYEGVTGDWVRAPWTRRWGRCDYKVTRAGILYIQGQEEGVPMNSVAAANFFYDIRFEDADTAVDRWARAEGRYEPEAYATARKAVAVLCRIEDWLVAEALRGRS